MEQSRSNASAVLGATQSLYRKYRPQTFQDGELVGQDAIVRTLTNAIVLDRVAHAYLFTGPRGTGKTTTARLLAKAVNCLDPNPANRPCNLCDACLAISRGTATDIIEIDAASNRGIDDIRDLRERVKFAPTSLRTKFYIVDEAHQITGAAANAFLKTLEEPPGHTKFILATTDPEQLLPTIISRCQRFDFRRIDPDAIARRVANVAELEGIAIEREAIEIVSTHSSGSLRDALGLLDQLASFGNQSEGRYNAAITVEDVRKLLGIGKDEQIEQLVEALADRDAARGLEILNIAFESGEDPRHLNRQLTNYLRKLMLLRAGGKADDDDRARNLAERFTLSEFAFLSRLFSETDFRVRHSAIPQLPIEISLVEGILRDTLNQERRSNSAAEAGTASPSRDPRHPVQPRQAASLSAREESVVPSLNDTTKPTSVISEVPVNSDIESQAAPQPAITVERLQEQWAKIRLDVKARDRRIEALLSSCDPLSVDGENVTLVTNYKFHSEKLNEDASKAMISSVISRLFGRDVTVGCELRGAISPTEPENGRTAANDVRQGDMDADDVEARRVIAAKNIFDADEITR